MCGWPFIRAEPRPQLVVAPVPSGSRYQGRPVYFTDLIVRRDRGYRTLEDTFGGRIAWTADTSHSGFNAPRHHLLAFRAGDRPRLYSESIGPVLTPARSLASVVEGTADVAPMDSYALDLIRRHEPERVAAVTVIASTAAAPIPALVASSDVDAATRLRQAFLRAGDDPDVAATLAALGLSGFAAVAAEDYRLATRWEQDALSAGYPRPE
jgi:ABC-type phosphate/phosphonate transport system substrate-binding protein